MKLQCKKCGKTFQSQNSKFCSLECAYGYSKYDEESYLMLRLA
ncbi:MAG: hypothetical protein V3T63_00240 [Nitrosopumilaceae archaeon]